MKPSPPNILFVCLEDTSPRLGAYGDPLTRSPNFDRIAAEGALFRQCFSTAPVCGPSRSSVITGMYQNAIQCQNMRTIHTNEHAPELPTPYVGVPPPHVKCFTEYLRSVGYFCAAQGKADYQFMREIQGYPASAFDSVVEPMQTNVKDGSRGGIPEPIWRKRSAGAPFFAFYNLDATHESGQWPRADRLHPETDPAAVTVPPYLPDTLEVRKTIARQYDNIAKDDVELGRLLALLEEDGLLDQTIVVVWADHGEGLPRSKRSGYSAGYHVPLAIRYPQLIQPATVVGEPVSNVDLAPTLFHLAGLPIPPHFHGVPIAGPEAQQRSVAFSGRDRLGESYDCIRSIRDQRYTYIRNYDLNHDPYSWEQYRHQHPATRALEAGHAAGTLNETQERTFFGDRAGEELFDRESDPYELNNLADHPEHRERLLAFRQALKEWERDNDPWRDLSEETMVRLFWPDGVQPRTAKPRVFPLGAACNGFQPLRNGDRVPGPALIQLHCATQGASIVYALEPLDRERQAAWRRRDEPDRLDTSWRAQATLESPPNWKLYTRPLQMGTGTWLLRAKAIRYGYSESEETSWCGTIA